MSYEETCEYLFNQTANYESQGQGGYKSGLDNMLKLDEHYQKPHQNFKCIHVGGTNGKGSVSHTLAAILQVAGYRVGLYTSPHLVDFTERIRVNGQPITEDYVTDFVEQGKALFEQVGATFFEITTEMAFKYFYDNDVDIAVVEVGLGGRLDSTNIITPIVSVITNVSLDHTQILGGSIEQIAMEKAGIIKDAVPVVIGEAQPELRPIFEAIAQESDAPIYYSEDEGEVLSDEFLPDGGGIYYKTKHLGDFKGELCGSYQIKNTRTVLTVLNELVKQGFLCQVDSPQTRLVVQKEMSEAFLHVTNITGLKGRWQTVRTNPTVICDTGHNVGAWEYLSKQLNTLKCEHLHIVFGMVDDKDIYGVMSLLPKEATYYFTKATTKRALPEQSVQVFGQQFELSGECYPTVEEAFSAAMKAAGNKDCIFVGGSSYVVADFLKTRD
ncbi:MAG: bifunctional folylpolyglutamate synthase/dihydrofolate synthase [Prevotella sp.]|nr:bifunctional folylpolyglutamate synthase/dihydrofolate synthase [Prevotella sp.]